MLGWAAVGGARLQQLLSCAELNGGLLHQKTALASGNASIGGTLKIPSRGSHSLAEPRVLEWSKK